MVPKNLKVHLPWVPWQKVTRRPWQLLQRASETEEWRDSYHYTQLSAKKTKGGMGRESESYPQTIPPGSTISGWQSEESHWKCSMAPIGVLMWKSAGRSGKGSMCCSAELIMAKGQTRWAHLPKKRSLLLLLFEVQDLLRGGLVANISTGINLLRGDDLFF